MPKGPDAEGAWSFSAASFQCPMSDGCRGTPTGAEGRLPGVADLAAARRQIDQIRDWFRNYKSNGTYDAKRRAAPAPRRPGDPKEGGERRRRGGGGYPVRG